MRVALFTETFLPKIDGIVTRMVRTLEQLRELGHEAIIFAPQNPPESFAGFPVIKVPAVPFYPWYPELFLGLPRPRLGRELDHFKPDIVHVVNPVVLGMWGTAIAKQRNLPLLASFHTDLPQYVAHLKLGFLKPLSHTWIRDVHNQAHVNLCTSQPMVNSAQGLGIKRVRLWPKAVDTERYHPGNKDRRDAVQTFRRATRAAADGLRREAVVRETPRLALRADHPTGGRTSGVRGFRPGRGVFTRTLRQERRPSFTGYMGGEELAQAYASADVFAFPSNTETLGFVAMESMASGVPVVGARAGGIPDVIAEGENGLMFTPGDLGDLTEKLGTLLFDADLRETFGRRSRLEMEKLGLAGGD